MRGAESAMPVVFKLWHSIEEGRPEIDFLRVPWDTDWESVCAGTATVSLPLKRARRGQPREFFRVDGTLGAASERIAAYLEAHSNGTLLFRHIEVGGAPFRLLVPGVPVDWFDRARSSVEVFDDSDHIRDVTRHVFRPDVPDDAAVFVVPDLPYAVFANERAVLEIQGMGARGLAYIQVCDG